MVTLSREVPPGKMDMGEKLLFISAGKERPCACTVCPATEIERINTPIIKRDSIDLFIFILSKPASIQIKKMKPTPRGRFRNWLTTAFPNNRNQRPNIGSGSKHPQTKV